MTVFVTVTREGKSALVRESIAPSDAPGRPRAKYCGSFPIEPSIPDEAPANVRRYLGDDSTKIAVVDEWLANHRQATRAIRERTVIEALKSAVLDTMAVLGTGATLSADDRIEMQQVLLGLREIVET